MLLRYTTGYYLLSSTWLGILYYIGQLCIGEANKY